MHVAQDFEVGYDGVTDDLQDEHVDVEDESTADQASLFEGHTTSRQSRMHMTAASITPEHEATGTPGEKMVKELHDMAAARGACRCGCC